MSRARKRAVQAFMAVTAQGPTLPVRFQISFAHREATQSSHQDGAAERARVDLRSIRPHSSLMRAARGGRRIEM